MRDRLIELIEKGQFNYYASNGSNGIGHNEYIADYLLENGVIVPPCKVGDIVYVIECCKCGHNYGLRCGANRILKNTKWLDIVKIPPTYHYTRCLKLFERPFKIEYLNRIGKTVFLTREEAEAKMKEGVQE